MAVCGFLRVQKAVDIGIGRWVVGGGSPKINKRLEVWCGSDVLVGRAFNQVPLVLDGGGVAELARA